MPDPGQNGQIYHRSSSSKNQHRDAYCILMKTARRSINAACRSQCSKPDCHPDTADRENSGTQTLQQRYSETYAAQCAQSLRNLSRILIHALDLIQPHAAYAAMLRKNQGSSSRECGTIFISWTNDCSEYPVQVGSMTLPAAIWTTCNPM